MCRGASAAVKHSRVHTLVKNQTGTVAFDPTDDSVQCLEPIELDRYLIAVRRALDPFNLAAVCRQDEHASLVAVRSPRAQDYLSLDIELLSTDEANVRHHGAL